MNNLNYLEYQGRLFVASNEITEDKIKNLGSPEEAKTVSINSYGSGKLGRIMEFLGYAIEVRGENQKTYYVNKKSYQNWLGRVNALNNVNDLTIENMAHSFQNMRDFAVGKAAALLSRREGEVPVVRNVKSDVTEILSSKENESLIKNFQNGFIEKNKYSLNRNASHLGLSDVDRDTQILGSDVKQLIMELDSEETREGKLNILQSFEKQGLVAKQEGVLKIGYSEDNSKLLLRLAIVLAGGGPLLRMIREMPKENLDPNLSKIYEGYKEVADCIVEQKWPTKKAVQLRSTLTEREVPKEVKVDISNVTKQEKKVPDKLTVIDTFKKDVAGKKEGHRLYGALNKFLGIKIFDIRTQSFFNNFNQPGSAITPSKQLKHFEEKIKNDFEVFYQDYTGSGIKDPQLVERARRFVLRVAILSGGGEAALKKIQDLPTDPDFIDIIDDYKEAAEFIRTGKLPDDILLLESEFKPI